MNETFYSNNRSEKRTRIMAAVCFLLVITGVLYRPLTGYDFIVFDDDEYVYKNPAVREGLTADGVVWALTTRHSANWHPITWISHMIDVEVFGMVPGGHHLTNLLIHMMNTLLLFGVFYRMTNDFLPSVFVATLFGIHPLHVESVAWISERKDVLCTFFGFASLWCYAEYVQRDGKLCYLLALLLFILGLGAKPMLVTWPFVLLLLDVWPLNRLQGMSVTETGFSQQHIKKRKPGFLIREKLPWMFFSFLSCIVTIWAQNGSDALVPVTSVHLGDRLYHAVVSYTEYIIKALVPWPLAVFYPYENRLPTEVIFLSGFVFFLFFLLALVTWKRHPFITVGWLWFVGTLIPVIGIIQVGMQAMADRYMYIPLTGLSIMVAWAFLRFRTSRVSKWVVTTAFFLILVSYYALAHRQISYWASSQKLFAHALEVTGSNELAQYNLGVALSQAGKPAEAIPHYQAVLAMNPSHVKAHDNLGVDLEAVGRVEDAFFHFTESLRILPDNPYTLTNLGAWYVRQGHPENAIEYIQKAIALNSGFAGAYNTLAVAYCRTGREKEALENFRQAVRLDPNFFQAADNLKKAEIRGLCKPVVKPSHLKKDGSDQ